VLGRRTAKSLQRFLLLILALKYALVSSQKILSATFSKRYTHHLFAIQGDETKTADLDQLAQLLVFVRFVGPSSIEEEMLFCRPLETTTEADVFQVVATCFDNSGTKWEKLVGICTDFALAMLGSRSGLFVRINQKVPIPLNLAVRSTVRLGFQLQMAYLLDIFHRLNN